MIEENGTVVDINPEGIWVETIKQSACSSCAAKNGCGQKLLASAGAGKRFIFKVSNPENLQVRTNDKVVVGVPESAFIKATLFMYLVPLMMLFLGAFVAEMLGLPESAVIVAAFSALAVGLLLVRFGSHALLGSSQYQPALVKVTW